MSQPVAASYCTTFLKPEMHHIHRQVTGLRRWRNVVVTLRRENAGMFPFEPVEVLGRAHVNPLRRVWLKYARREDPFVYRGEYEALSAALDRHGARLLHIYFGHTAVHLLPFMRRWGGPCVVSFHGMDAKTREDRPAYAVLLREVFSRARLVLARSEALGARLGELGCPSDKLRLNRTGIPVEEFAPVNRDPPADGAWHIVQACRLIEKKGLPTALRAFACFAATHPQARFTIAGEGPLRTELEKLTGELGIGARVHFAGFLDHGALRALYGAAHVFLHPSRTTLSQDREGIPNAMLEAMATGLPVVATRHSGIPEAVCDGVSGILVQEDDDAGAANALEQIAAKPDLWRRMGAAAAEDVRAEFGLERQVECLEACYDEAAA